MVQWMFSDHEPDMLDMSTDALDTMVTCPFLPFLDFSFSLSLAQYLVGNALPALTEPHGC